MNRRKTSLMTACGTNSLGSRLRYGLVWLAVLASTRSAGAQSLTKETPPDFLDEARKYVIQSTNDRVRLELNEKSVLNWTNPVRQQERGATYIWSHKRRPYVIASLFSYVYNEKVNVKHEFHSLALSPLQATFDGVLAWTPSEPGVIWKEVPGAPEPAGTRISRLLQMRQLARNFRAELTSPKNERNELRLSPRPLYEYSSPEAGVLDGAIMSFVVATDPEILLLMEAYEEDRNGKHARGFRYACARFHYWDVAVFHGDDKVWHASLDKSHENNNLGDRENISKVYNSFHPYRGANAPQSNDAAVKKSAEK